MPEPDNSFKGIPFRSTPEIQALDAMRAFLVLLCLGLAGCAPFAVKPDPDRPMAHLTVGDKPGETFSVGYSGVVDVDDRDIPGGPVRSIHVAPGARSIGYRCPGSIILDGPPKLSAEFEADTAYVLDCTGAPVIREAQDDT